jgi:hypothetical protein
VNVHQPSLSAIPVRLAALDTRVTLTLTAAAVFGAPFVMFYRLILFHFYIRGSFPYDTGLLASLMWHNPALELPSGLGGGSFFAQHVAPILSLVSAASELLPLSMPQMFASFVGLCHGLLALAIFWLLAGGYGMRRGWPLAFAASTSVAFAFNGLALAIVRFPHFETFAAACLLLCFVALVLEHRAIAVVCLLFALATREDVGLHAFCFLAVWAVINRLRHRPWRDSVWIICLAIAGLTYSGAALFLQHLAFPDSSSFVRIYLGYPPLAHLSVRFVGERLPEWVWLHPAIILPAVASVVWGIQTRNPYVSAGYLACVPWAVLHLLAVSLLAGVMAGYYAYPFLIAMAWPWLAVLIGERREAAVAIQPIPAAARLLAVIVLSLVPVGADYNPGRIRFPDAFLHAPSAERQVLTGRAIAAIASGRPALGRLVVDSGVMALLPSAFSRDELAGLAKTPADTVVFLTDGFDAERLRAAPDLPVRYAVPGTSIRIMTNRPEQTLRDLGLAP